MSPIAERLGGSRRQLLSVTFFNQQKLPLQILMIERAESSLNRSSIRLLRWKPSGAKLRVGTVDGQGRQLSLLIRLRRSTRTYALVAKIDSGLHKSFQDTIDICFRHERDRPDFIRSRPRRANFVKPCSQQIASK